MKHLPIFLFLLILISSCKKEQTEQPEIVYTSDMPDEFETYISVIYDQDDNSTSVKIFFRAEIGEVILRLLKLPENSYVSYNGTQLPGEYTFEKTFPGKENAVIDFMNFDENLYSNLITIPDTIYFKDLPDTVNSNEDLLIEFGGPVLENDEIWDYTFISRQYGDYADLVTSYSADSVVLIENSFLEPNTHHPMSLTRIKTLKNPNLPMGGGRVTYRYIITKTIYSE